MGNIIETKRLIAELGTKAQEVVNDPRLTNQQKKARLDQYQVDLKTYSDELTVHQRAGQLMGGGSLLGANDGFSSFNTTERKSQMTRGTLPLRPSDENMQALFKSAHDGQSITIKSPSTTSTVDPATFPNQVLPPVAIRRDPTRILDLLPATTTDAAVQQYYVASLANTGTATGAAVVAEGAQKPESDLVLTKQTVTAAKIAVWANASEEALTDYGAFQSFLEADLVAQVINAENQLLLSSAIGTGADTFNGLLTAPGTQTYTRGTITGETQLDAISEAMDNLRAGGRYVEADGILLNVKDLGAIRRLKSTLGTYIFGDPSQSGTLELWGLPVVVSSQVPVGTAVVGNFESACQVWVREGMTIRSNAQGTGFRQNLIEFIVEERLSMGVVAPQAISIVDIAAPA